MMETGKEVSHITMTIVTSTGTYLNGCLQPQHTYIDMDVTDPDGREVVRVGLSFEQVARMMLNSGRVECTLLRYRDGGKLVSEDVEVPESVRERMKRRMGEVQGNVEGRLEDIRRDVYDMVASKKVSLKELRKVLHDIEVVQSHITTNTDYVVGRAEEELESIAGNVAGQLGVMLSASGVEVSREQLRRLIPVEGGVQSLPGAVEEGVPVEEGYRMKDRSGRGYDEMGVMEVADRLSGRLSQLEQEESGNRLYGSMAVVAGNKVQIQYVSYHRGTSLSLKQARKYLEFLEGIGGMAEFQRHFEYFRGHV